MGAATAGRKTILKAGKKYRISYCEIDEFALMTEFNYWPYTTGTKRNQTFYIFAGIGLTFYNPQGEYNEEWVDLRPLGTEGQQTDLSEVSCFTETTTITLPMGMGYRRSLARDWSMTTEVGWRQYGSDYMDDTSGDYVNAAQTLLKSETRWLLTFQTRKCAV